MLTVSVWVVPDLRRRFLPQIKFGQMTLTISHLAKAIGLLYLYLVGLMVIVRVSYGYTGIPAGRVPRYTRIPVA